MSLIGLFYSMKNAMKALDMLRLRVQGGTSTEQTNNDVISESCYHTLHYQMLPYFIDSTLCVSNAWAHTVANISAINDTADFNFNCNYATTLRLRMQQVLQKSSRDGGPIGQARGSLPDQQSRLSAL